MGELAKPGVVVEQLKRHGIRLSRSRGQNFLVDGNVLRRIMEAASVDPGETILEIGPGIGVLTEELCRRAARVVAVEMDDRLARVLRENLGDRGNLEVVEGDVLKVDLASLFREGEKVKVVSNLPYNVATPTVIRLLLELPESREMILLVQRELAERYSASPGSPAYGAVSVKIQVLSRVEMLFRVPPSVFLPTPRVESCLIRLSRKEGAPAPRSCRPFFHFLDKAFSSRRKTLLNSLGSGREAYLPRERVSEVLSRLGIPPNRRAEELSPGELLRLHRALTPP